MDPNLPSGNKRKASPSSASASASSSQTNPSPPPGVSKNANLSEALICVDILGTHFSGVLDTGSCESMIGDDVIKLVREQNVAVNTLPFQLTLGFGEGQTQSTREAADLEMNWHNGQRRSLVSFLMLPGLSCPVLLGRNFIAQSGVVINMGGKSWGFFEEPGKFYPLDTDCKHSRPGIIDKSTPPSKRPRQEEEEDDKSEGKSL